MTRPPPPESRLNRLAHGSRVSHKAKENLELMKRVEHTHLLYNMNLYEEAKT